MPVRGHAPGVQLPQSIREEIEAQDGVQKAGRRPKSSLRDRKAERKAERQHAKGRKAQFFSGGLKKRVADTVFGDEKEQRKRQKLTVISDGQAFRPDHPAEPTLPKNDKKAPTYVPQKNMRRNEDEKTVITFEPAQSRREEEEDVYISMLEKKLGLKKGKTGKSRYGAAFEDDGLLELLADLNEVDNGFNKREHETESDRTHEDSEEEQTGESDAEVSDASEEWTGFSNDNAILVKNPLRSQREEMSAARPDEGPSEATSRYVPPQKRNLRNNDVREDAAANAKLTRQLKGLLNRLSEQNIGSILKEIENFYQAHRRHDITSTLTALIIEGTCSHSILLDSYVALHAGLVACLHKIIGIELAAYFVQAVASSFELHYVKGVNISEAQAEAQPNDEPIGKECSNLLVLLSDLYNYHVISCTLMYDIIRLILEGEMTELDVELILKLARGSGAQLRQDDPSALKDIIQIVQSKISGQESVSSRTRFMVETLNNLKNNRLKKQVAHGSNESKDRISKFVTGIDKKHHVHAHEPLRISLDDLRQADSKGKWWLVGAAWGGDPLVDQQESRLKTTAPEDSENVLLKLAKKQGMNTDVRRSIFVVLMSSDDYVDACDRLSQLNLTEIQQREIVRVLLHCCGNEKTYNPYYTLIGQHLCRQSHSHKVTLQYCLWDFLRSLGETGVGGAEMTKSFEDDQDDNRFNLDRVSSTRMANIAKAYAWWIAKDSVAITVLKTLDFVTLKTKTKTFLKQLFVQLFISTQDVSPAPNVNVDLAISKRDKDSLEEVLLKAMRVPALMRGILHFLSTAFRNSDQVIEKMDTFLIWSVGSAKEVLQRALETGVLH